MADKSLPRLSPAQEKLGLPTIMDRALAAKHGAPYVHLAAFAIDVDRVREAVEGYGDPRPFAWEVLLTEVYVLARFGRDGSALLEDVVLSILEGEPDALGGQLAFAVWGRRRARRAARGAAARLRELARAPEGAGPRAREAVAGRVPPRGRAGRGCLEAPLDPPLAPPTREALERMAAREQP
ncbi:MAG: hypothetical protein M5U28_42720 [Sandaracinaceae bacterium]|nr:hypothetical protein [Sandaracinaceae bacterium]